MQLENILVLVQNPSLRLTTRNSEWCLALYNECIIILVPFNFVLWSYQDRISSLSPLLILNVEIETRDYSFVKFFPEIRNICAIGEITLISASWLANFSLFSWMWFTCFLKVPWTLSIYCLFEMEKVELGTTTPSQLEQWIQVYLWCLLRYKHLFWLYVL